MDKSGSATGGEESVPPRAINIVVRKAARPVTKQIHITVSSEDEVMDLRSLAEASVSKLGRQVSLSVSCVGAEKVVGIDLKIRPSDVGRNLYNTLERIAETIVNRGEWEQALLFYMKNNYAECLRGWSSGNSCLDGNVAAYIGEAYRFTSDAWSIGMKKIVSPTRGSGVAGVRRALFFALRNRFPRELHDPRGVGLSFPDIGRIMNKKHATVLTGCKYVEGVLSRKGVKIENYKLPSVVLSQVIGAYGGVRQN